ncbi:MAG: carboxypeptidase-like regulatory domain-containing protein [candidate division KSB1 bacterium]|nr:carboxypeptidase-like regulatory domain-containing protein [candidate division KSB1 bacterium]
MVFPAPSGRIRGKIVDAENGQALPGANVYLQDTNIGAATDIQGQYVIPNVPPGTYTLVVNYIGYAAKQVDVQVRPNETVSRDVQLDYTVLTGEDVVITAQARGQTEAINQQVSARTVKNIVSATKIQELPEANAAEAVGRLPGVSLERSGGEGTKVMIRGMGAKYTKVQIDGVDMTATGEGDRSSDLSMISPYMLAGIELTKSVMADQEATATGGIVNFRIRKAPEEPSFNVIAQGGYNGLRDTYNDYKVSVGGSNRFYANMLGVYAQVDYEKKNAGSQQMGGVGFSQENQDAPVRTNSMQLMDIFRNVQRLGGTMVLDLTLPSTEIKSTNFYSRKRTEATNYINNYNFTEQIFGINYTDTPKRWLTVLTNSLQIDHQVRNWEISALLSHSFSENALPAQIGSSNNNSPQNPFPTDRKSNFNVNLDPETIPYLLDVSMDEAVNFMHLGGIEHEESETKERDLTGQLDFTYNLSLSNQINMQLSFGGKYRHKSKEYDRLVLNEDNGGGSQEFRNLIYNDFEDEFSQRTLDAWDADNMRILLTDFLDPDYEGGDFLDGKYDFGNIFDKQDFRRIHELVMDQYDPVAAVSDMYAFPHQNFIESNFEDYHGTEDYHAFYLMPEINVTKFTFVPGVRFESNRTEYTGYRGNRLGVLRDWRATPIDTVTKVRTNEFVLPMIQAVYRPTNWLNFKAGYTHTLQRPNYNNIMPGWVIQSQGQIWNLSNFRLKPELSRNVDLQMSIYSDKIGLFTVGAFHKRITDMIFWTGQTVIQDTSFFELPSLMHRQRAAYAINNPNDAINYGYEVEWQSNFWYLPGLLNGLVMNVNYTRNESEAEYLRSVVKTQIDPITYRSTLISEDTTYTSPMINQPDHLLNLTVGYDYKGFSIRWAMRYKSRIFTTNSWYEKLRGYSTDFYRFDVMVRQQLPVDGLEFFMNINNLTGEREHNVINHMNFTSYLEDYGRSGNIGFRYRL